MKKKDKKEKKTEKKKADISEIDRRFEINSKIEELKSLAQNSYLSGNYSEAIDYAEKIIKLAVQVDLQSYVKEQEKFINNIASKLQQKYLLSEIQNTAIKILESYDNLIESENIEKAHEIVEDFKKKYEDFPDFESIPLVQKLIMKEKREWIKYSASIREDVEKEVMEEKEEKDLVDDLQRFLKTR